MSDFYPVRLFTWRTINHEFVEKRYGWPPFGWKIVEKPELCPETYYDKNDVLVDAGILIRTRSLRSDGRPHIEALKVDPRGPFVSIDRDEINDLITHHFRRSTGATAVRDLNPLCVMNTTRTVWEAKEKFRGVERRFEIVLDRTTWGHKVGMLVLLDGGVEDPHAQIDAFMVRHANFFNTWDVRVTMESWLEIMGFN